MRSPVLFPWTGTTRQAKGRNPFNADAIGVERDASESTVRIFNRVQSNGKTHIGWCAMPDDPELLRALAAELENLATETEGG